MRTSIFALAAALASGSFASEEDSIQAEVRAAFVLLAPGSSGQTVPMARVILDAADVPCPSLHPIAGKGGELPLSPRANPDKSRFPVTVCEAIYSAGEPMRVQGADIVLPRVPSSVRRATIFGDSGCDPKYQQGCDEVGGGDHWPLRAMADAAATTDPGPDLILHMGDYNYRGTPGIIRVDGRKVRVYDAGDQVRGIDCKLRGPYLGQNSPGSDMPDRWENWWRDFFEPANELLTAAPWVFARGNHELCSRAGPGWFYFLDAGSSLVEGGTGQLGCPPADSAEPLVFRPPYRVDLGGLSIVVLDSANACDRGHLQQGHFDRQFEEIASLVGRAPGPNAIWLQSHRPLWAVRKAYDVTPEGNRGPSARYEIIDPTLQSAYVRHPAPRPLHLVVSGHMHRFQAIGFAAAGGRRRPAQLVVGNSGVALGENQPDEPFSFPIDGMMGTGFGLSEFGYMEIELAGSGSWRGRLLGRTGKLLAKCDSAMKYESGLCAPVR